MSKLRAAVRVETERSSISAIAGPDRQLSVRCSDAATFDGDQCSLRLSLAFLFALAVSILAFADVQIFSASLVFFWCCCFFVHYSSSGTECLTVLRCETDGVHCGGNYPNAQAELRAGRRAFCRSGLCIFRMSGTFQVKGVGAFPFFLVYFSLYVAQHLRLQGRQR